MAHTGQTMPCGQASWLAGTGSSMSSSASEAMPPSTVSRLVM